MSTYNAFKIGAIGIGQGGTKIAQSFMHEVEGKLEHLCSINLSKDDLVQAKLVQLSNRLHLDENMSGAGKKRDVSKLVCKEKIREIGVFLEKIYEKRECNLFLVFFSTSGGTGSGAGPFITSLLENKIMDKIKSNHCVIMGVPLIGDLDEGSDLILNTLDCLREVNTLGINKAARFMPIYNQSQVDIKDDVIKCQTINNEAIRLLKRYLFENYPSEYSNLDPEDRFVLLSTPGIHSLLTYNPEDMSLSSEELSDNTKKIIHTPFLMPKGTAIRRLGCELPMDKGKSRFDLIQFLGSTVSEPNYLGLFDDKIETNAIPIVHFAGFNNLSSCIETYDNQYKRLNQVNEIGTETNTKGNAFKNVQENIRYTNEKNSMNNNQSVDDLFNSLM